MRHGRPVIEDHIRGRDDLELRSTLDLVELIDAEATAIDVIAARSRIAAAGGIVRLALAEDAAP